MTDAPANKVLDGLIISPQQKLYMNTLPLTNADIFVFSITLLDLNLGILFIVRLSDGLMRKFIRVIIRVFVVRSYAIVIGIYAELSDKLRVVVDGGEIRI